jgi:hypothetical protein
MSQSQSPRKPSDLYEYYSDKARDIFRGLIAQGKIRKHDPSIEEAQEEVIRKANKYDTVELSEGWVDVVQFMLTLVNREIAEATEAPMEPEKQRLHVLRWNAMREIVDSTLSEIADTRKERDRIIELRREEETWQKQA